MKKLVLALSWIILFSCQGGDKHYESYNITGPEKVETGASVSISVKGDSSSSGDYRASKKDTRNVNITNPNYGGNQK